jgi:flavodoxin
MKLTFHISTFVIGFGVVMKVCIAYESRFGNGKKLVEHMQRTISKKGHDVEIYSIRETKPDSLPNVDVYIFSSPTQIGGPPGKMKKFLKKLKINQEGARYALMETYMYPESKTLQKMEEILQSKGMTKISDEVSIKVNGMKGPLEEGYEEKLEEFIKKIL